MKKILVLASLLLIVASLAYAVCFLDFVSEGIPDATVNQAYSFQLDVCCGTPPYTFSIHSGSLPTGLSLSSSGLISGTPTQVENTTVFIRLTDSASPNCTLVRAYEVYVN